MYLEFQVANRARQGGLVLGQGATVISDDNAVALVLFTGDGARGPGHEVAEVILGGSGFIVGRSPSLRRDDLGN